MARKKSAVATLDTTAVDPISAAMAAGRPSKSEVRSAIRSLRQAHYAERAGRSDLLDLYRGGLPAEQTAAAAVTAIGRTRTRSARAKVRAEYVARIGRRIDLVSLLSQSRADGAPVWTVADPLAASGPQYLGGDHLAHDYYCSGEAVGRTVVVAATHGLRDVRLLDVPCRSGKRYRPTGMPPLPSVARDLATDKTIRRRARWVGVLYQPMAWEEVQPKVDPAIVVEWLDRPGEYYALAVWGGDRPAIMEFVD